MESPQSYDTMLQVNLATYASACDSADGKVERRRNDGWNVAGAKRPSANRRRKHTDYSLLRDAARDERAFCEVKQMWSSGRQGRPSACEMKQESALVTAVRGDFPLNSGVFDCQQNCQQRSNKRVVPE